MKIYTAQETVYKSTHFKVAGNIWNVTQASGKFNYVSVRKATNNPFGGLGKEFPTWDAAGAHYKNPNMKAALILAEAECKTIN